MNENEFKKYIVFYGEQSDGPQCNGDNICLVESPVFPTEEILRESGLIVAGGCNNVSYPGCEDCSGSRIVGFNVECHTPERAMQLGLVDKLYGSEGIGSCFDNYLHRIKPK